MAYAGKTYKYEKDENFDKFVDSLGLPAERAEVIKTFKATQSLTKNGDSYTLFTTSENGDKTLTFKDGVEIDEPLAPGVVAKTTFTVNGNTLTQVQKFDDGRTMTLKREYSADKLVVTITTSFWDGTAVRYYTAA